MGGAYDLGRVRLRKLPHGFGTAINIEGGGDKLNEEKQREEKKFLLSQ